MRPIMVEFTGTPEAGKTTVIQKLRKILEELNFKVHVIRESAELTPKELSKSSWDGTVWMRLITCSNILHSQYIPCDIVLIDRGAIDAKFYGLKYFKSNQCSIDDYISYMSMFTSKLNPNFLITLTANPEVALARKGGSGKIVNAEFLEEYNNLLHSFYETVTIPKTLIDTSSMSIDDVTSQALEVISTLIKAR